MGTRRLPPALLAVFRTPHLAARLRVRRDVPGFLRVHFLATGARAQIFPALSRPAAVDEVAATTGVVRSDLLERLLELGVALGELSRTDGRYALRGRAARALASDDGDAVAALLEELSDYHSRVYVDLPLILRGAPEPDYLSGRRSLIARSSRIVEPTLAELVRRLVADRAAARILDVGCGSGIYLRRALELDPAASGVGIDIAPEVVEQAQRDLADNGLAHRAAVVAGDVRSLPPEADGPFDVVTLFNNIYYFAEEERPHVFRELATRLSPAGALAVVSMMRGSTPSSLDLDIVLGATAGCTLLPEEDRLVAQLRDAGLPYVERVPLVPGEPLSALVASLSPPGV